MEENTLYMSSALIEVMENELIVVFGMQFWFWPFENKWSLGKY